MGRLVGAEWSQTRETILVSVQISTFSPHKFACWSFCKNKLEFLSTLSESYFQSIGYHGCRPDSSVYLEYHLLGPSNGRLQSSTDGEAEGQRAAQGNSQTAVTALCLLPCTGVGTTWGKYGLTLRARQAQAV